MKTLLMVSLLCSFIFADMRTFCLADLTIIKNMNIEIEKESVMFCTRVRPIPINFKKCVDEYKKEKLRVILFLSKKKMQN